MKTFIDIIKQNLVENRIWNEEDNLTSPVLELVERKTQGMSLPDQKAIAKFIVNIIKKEPTFFHKLSPGDLITLKKESELDVTDWDMKDANSGTLLGFGRGGRGTTDAIFWNNIVHIIDWLSDIVVLKGIGILQQYRGIQKLNIATQHADKYFAEKNKKAEDGDEETEKEGTKTILALPGGVRWVKVFSEQCLDREGKVMGHCVGSYARKVDRGDVEIYSLRDRNNEPHITIEFDPRSGTVFQIKGKQNEPPVEKYWPYVVDFLKLPFVKVVKTADFDVKHLTPEQQDDLFAVKPDFATYDWLYKKEGITERVLRKTEEYIDYTFGKTENILFDAATGKLIVEQDKIDGFVDRLGKKDSRGDNALEYVAKYVLDEDFYDMDIDSTSSDVMNMLYDLPRNVQDALYVYVKEKYKEEPDNLNELFDKLKEEDDDLVDQLHMAYRRGYESGTYSEMYDDFWSTIEQWDGDGFSLVPPSDGYKQDSNWKLEIDPAYFFEEIKPDGVIYASMIDNGVWTQDEGIYLDQPYNGWSGFDKDAALEYIKDESDLSDYIKPNKKEKKQA